MFYLRTMTSKPNKLIHAASPYLLQHAYNPVEWFPWCDEALDKAKKEDKLLLISVGYSACHWCHVMEHECFEDEDVAALMNDFFVCIKVDREERPDIDQVYMSAVQLLTGRGGWPLNCFALPDGRPVYGGTYFPKKQWMEVLGNLASMYRGDRGRLETYAKQLTDGVAASDELKPSEDKKPDADIVHEAVAKWKKLLDYHEGGPDRAPKFPLPNNYLFLMRYAFIQQDNDLTSQVRLTLKKMAFGGIYDQIGGGFARYSVDGIWKVPHFEKMLYDNAQLLSLYAEAYRCWRDPLYRDVVYQTTSFMEREWLSPEGGFYSALDADSEGEEGKFYVWKLDELKELLGDDFELTSEYFNINERGYWEHGNHIPLRHDSDEQIAERFGVSNELLRERVDVIRAKMLHIRNNRVRPGLDDKLLTSWNALAVSGLVEAYRAFGDDKFLKRAKSVFNFLMNQMRRVDGGLHHSWKQGSEAINGFLEDYAFTISAALDLYVVTLDHTYVDLASEFTNYSVQHFYDGSSNLFRFTSDLDAPLFVSKLEYQDNVIPASNSQMAHNLSRLSYYTGNADLESKCLGMIQMVLPMVSGYGSAFSNWLDLIFGMQLPKVEKVVCGKDAVQRLLQMNQSHYEPYVVFDGSVAIEQTPATKNRLPEGKTVLYVCRDSVCGLPEELSGD